MHILIAPNAFKGSLSASEVARAIAAGLRKSGLDCSLELIPIADGGDGTAELISKNLFAKKVICRVHDPLGSKINTSFGWVANKKTAILDLANASGLRLINRARARPLIANTRGTGELIKCALDKGAQKIILGIGGSATVDGGSGLLHELGVKFLDSRRKEIENLPAGLLSLKEIDAGQLDSRIFNCEVTVLCDVTNKLLGRNGAAAVFGPQKGAGEKEVAILERCLSRLSSISTKATGVDMDSLKYGGSAGGVAAAMKAYLGAQLVSGISYFLETVNFEKATAKSDLILTAEGKLDEQTLEGKGPFGVATTAMKYGISVVFLTGQMPAQISAKLHKYFNVIIPVGHGPSTIEEAIHNTSTDLQRTAFELGKLLSLQNNWKNK